MEPLFASSRGSAIRAATEIDPGGGADAISALAPMCRARGRPSLGGQLRILVKGESDDQQPAEYRRPRSRLRRVRGGRHRPGGRPGRPPQWLTALNERSEALNREYGLGDHANRRQLGAPGPNWLVALKARSEAMNRKYGLGEYGRQGAGTASSSDWLVALNVRSDALNRKYGLGDDRPTRQAGG